MCSTASIIKMPPKQADFNTYKEGRILLVIEAIQKKKIKYQVYKQLYKYIMYFI